MDLPGVILHSVRLGRLWCGIEELLAAWNDDA